MEILTKKIYCDRMNTEVNISYHLLNINTVSGALAKREVVCFDCKFKQSCGISPQLTSCVGFRKMIQLEEEINS